MRQSAQEEQTYDAENMGRHNQGSVPNPVGEFDAQGVNHKLGAEIKHNQPAYFFKGDMKLILENDEKQWGQVVDDGLRDEAGVAGE